MTELEKQLRLQANAAITLVTKDSSKTKEQLMNLLAMRCNDIFNGVAPFGSEHLGMIELASLALRLAAMAHREAVQREVTCQFCGAKMITSEGELDICPDCISHAIQELPPLPPPTEEKDG